KREHSARGHEELRRRHTLLSSHRHVRAVEVLNGCEQKYRREEKASGRRQKPHVCPPLPPENAKEGPRTTLSGRARRGARLCVIAAPRSRHFFVSSLVARIRPSLPLVPTPLDRSPGLISVQLFPENAVALSVRT